MKKAARTIFVLGSILSLGMLMAGVSLVNAGQNGFSEGQNGMSVGVDAYDVGKVTLSEYEAYYGDSITVMGSGQLAGASIEVYMGGTYEGDNETYLARLGTTPSDAGGNWSLTFTVPTTCTKMSDGTTVAVFPAYWPVVGVTLGPDSAYYTSWSDPDLLVNGAAPAATQASTYNSGTSAATLPATGSATTMIGMALIASGMLCFGVTRFAFVRSRAGLYRDSE
ncbi:MAG: hypothetical protein Q7K29_06705 [Thermoleophilia bacterium]|nr:hypothetical protein [Thermoleophilia bacterium]